MSVLVAVELDRAASFLASRGVENARLEAEVLLADVLGFDRARLFAELRRALDDAERWAFEELLGRRGRREPLQHVRGRQEFFSREFLVDGRVLVPRPETEILVETVLRATRALSSPSILDVGCGSGVIGLTLALERPRGAVFLSDVSPAAVDVARENARRLGLAGRVEVCRGDLFSPYAYRRFDVVACNPPYVPSGELERLAPEVRDHEPRLALDGGPDGLAFYRRLAAEAGGVLQGDAALVVEIGEGQSGAVAAIFSAAGLRVVAVQRDLAGLERVLTVRRG
jgi:release factor glutamine methyltransferase